MARFSSQNYDPISIFEGWVAGLESPSDFKQVLQLFTLRFQDHIYLRQQVLYHKGDLSNVIENILKSRKIVVTNLNSKSWIFTASKTNKDTNEITQGLFLILPGINPNMYRVVTISKSLFWNSIVRKLVRQLYPEAMRVFFKQDEIHESLDILQSSLGAQQHRIHILDATLKAKRESETKNGVRKFNTDRVWRDQSINEMFDEAMEKTQWFSSLTFAIQKEIKKTGKFLTLSTGRISKFGEISSDFYFDTIEDGLISILENFAFERLQLYQNRGIKERNFIPSPPLQIDYEYDVFSDIEEIRRFGKTMIRYPDSSIAVYHGNPYYHANIADFSDGSSFDLWILSPARVLIAPQAKASPQALERITSYIFYEFREGNIKEYVE